MNDWLTWRGLRELKGDKLVRVRFRNGKISKQALPANKWRGRYGKQANGKSFPDNYDYDIVAVQVVK